MQVNHQTMTKIPVKFRMNRYKTVGGVVPTRYLLSLGDERTEGWKDGEPKNLVPPLFVEKTRDN